MERKPSFYRSNPPQQGSFWFLGANAFKCFYMHHNTRTHTHTEVYILYTHTYIYIYIHNYLYIYIYVCVYTHAILHNTKQGWDPQQSTSNLHQVSPLALLLLFKDKLEGKFSMSWEGTWRRHVVVSFRITLTEIGLRSFPTKKGILNLDW